MHIMFSEVKLTLLNPRYAPLRGYRRFMARLQDIHLTILVDNVSEREALKAEHGFSCLVEADGHVAL